ncbi:pepsin/retropepsin-like aspartic protease family protein [Ponticaulis koreensis]|uniref:hypothetical protein n=1 Tax=Ponticaulis koreensis TaxID=1123045 RepID=UPI0003B6FAE2|nr:hypothetical protein [Ponticaulis koreensis]
MIARLLCLLACLTAPLVSAEDRILNTEMCGTYFFIKVVLDRDDGRSEEERTLRMLYDTGASSNFVDQAALARASGVHVATGEMARIHEADAGDIHFNFIRARVRDLSHLTTSLGYPIDGIFSHDVFEDFTIVLDYQAEAITLTQLDLPRPDGEWIFNTRRGDERPWLDMRFNGRRQRVLVDTGSGTTLAMNRLGRYETMTEPVNSGYAARFDRMEPRRAARLDGNVTLGDITFRQPMLTETPSNQLFGGALLSQFRISYDPSEERMMFEPYEDGPITTPPYRSIGVAFAPQESLLEVVARLTDAAPDLIEGDLITHIDGASVGTHGCRPRTDTSPREITRLRDGVSETLTVPIIDLVP